MGVKPSHPPEAQEPRHCASLHKAHPAGGRSSIGQAGVGDDQPTQVSHRDRGRASHTGNTSHDGVGARHRPMAGRAALTVLSSQRRMRKAGVVRSPSRAKGVKRCRVRQGAARPEASPQQEATAVQGQARQATYACKAATHGDTGWRKEITSV